MSHVPLQTRKPLATVVTPMLDFTGLGILQEALLIEFALANLIKLLDDHMDGDEIYTSIKRTLKPAHSKLYGRFRK
jgi:hypothetical protein